MVEKERKERKEKKDYQKPELKKEGNLRDITAGSAGSF